ncbi:MAG: hypothetical protein IJP66_01695, partial [Kiritimatiellae bacterium]|nr:hypothetical protein [Kiritimatiellia bacterium]
TPKKSFFALDQLINHEWRTQLTVAADADGAVAFRGFRGAYRARWAATDGKPAETTFDLA